MKIEKAVDRLPPGYRFAFHLSTRLSLWVQLYLFLAQWAAFLLAWLFLRWAFPGLLALDPGGPPWIDRYGIWVMLAVVVLLHELAHILAAWGFTGRWPALGVSWSGIYVNTAPWFFPRISALVTALAPFLALTALGLLLLAVLPPGWARLPAWAILLNTLGSLNDLAVALWVFFQPDGALIQNDGRELIFYRPQSESAPAAAWRARGRLFLERAWNRLSRR